MSSILFWSHFVGEFSWVRELFPGWGAWSERFGSLSGVHFRTQVTSSIGRDGFPMAFPWISTDRAERPKRPRAATWTFRSRQIWLRYVCWFPSNAGKQKNGICVRCRPQLAKMSFSFFSLIGFMRAQIGRIAAWFGFLCPDACPFSRTSH